MKVGDVVVMKSTGTLWVVSDIFGEEGDLFVVNIQTSRGVWAMAGYFEVLC